MTTLFSRLILFLLLSASLMADSRIWKSSNGESSFEGELISYDGENVTIRRGDGQVFTIDLNKLSKYDQSWLDQGSSADNSKPDTESLPDAGAVFDTLHFGDSRKDVTAKLMASKNVEALVDETFMGRFGLNGSFRTKRKIGGLHCELYFDWTKEGQLNEISLQTQPQDGATYDDLLADTWSQLSELLTTLHGKPIQRAGYPALADLQNDVFLASHLWRLESGGTAMLGTSMQADKYLIVVRFTTERIKPAKF